jgi:acyl-CoA synthetase (AMP-forming)/AMP-acid ligase II
MQPCPVGVEGMLGRSGPIPLGYYKDPDKTASTFKSVGGVRWSIPGDYARREEDGSVTLLGRGSVCINTGGEKVHPEEVEAVLLRHSDVFDASVVGVEHDRWGQQVTALVQKRDGSHVTEEQLRDHARSLISNYKVPKRIYFVPEIPRTAVSKVDYRASVELAEYLST